MASNLNVFDTQAEYEQKKAAGSLGLPNVSFVKSPEQVLYLRETEIGIASFESGVRRYYKLEDWNALSVKPTVLGVYVKTPDCGFIIHNDTFGHVFGLPEAGIPGVTTTNSLAGARQDFKGKENTAAIFSYMDEGSFESTLFTQVRAKQFADGSNAYLGAAGEIKAIFDNILQVDACRAAINSPALSGLYDRVLSSTLYNTSGQVWVWNDISTVRGLNTAPYGYYSIAVFFGSL